MHCKSCGEAGHNAAGCKKFPKEKKGRKKKNQEIKEAGTSQPIMELQETTHGADTITLTQRSSQWDQSDQLD
ncbi:putative transcription factor interactor and regulator CCHC(Zn) family [Arabidopsis thaliana]